jgi:hypothetical protein
MQRLLRLVGDDEVSAARAEGVSDPKFAAISKAVCDLAEDAAILSAEIAIEELDDYVQGAVMSELEELRSDRHAAGASAEATKAEAGLTAESLMTQAESRESEADRAESEIGKRSAEYDVAKEAATVAEAEYQELPLVVRAALKFAWVGVPATAAGVGALVHLALPGVHNPFAKWALIAAAVAAALLTELLIGTLCADLFQKLTGKLRAVCMAIAVMTLLSAIGTTEGFATHVRAQARSEQMTIETDDDGNLLSTGKALTPSLVWTFPLSLLLTLGGSGALGLNALREESETPRRRLKEAQRRLDEAEERLRSQEALPLQQRKEAEILRANAAHQKASAAAAVTETTQLIGAIDAEAKRHEQFIASLSSKARLRYRIAAAEREDHADKLTPRAVERGVLTIATIAGPGTAAGSALALAGAPLAGSLLTGSIVTLLFAALRSRAGRTGLSRRRT